MAKQTINIGASPNDGTGTPLRTAFDYTNQNFTELYTATGPSGNNIVVPGNATISGDLTVDTSTLKVDSANDAVGIGTVTPASYSASKLTVYTAANTLLTIGQATSYSNLQSNGYDFYINTNVGGAGSNAGSFTIRHGSSSAVQYNITSGVHTWQNVGGVAGTAMTLNSTGLGVGGSPTNNLAVQTSSAKGGIHINYSGSTIGLLGIVNPGVSNNTIIGSVSNNSLELMTNNSTKATIDSSGNVGIGVVPASGKKLDVKSDGTANTTFAAQFRDSADAVLFSVRSDGYFNTGSSPLSPYNNITGSAANMFVDSSGFVYRSTSSLKYKTDVKDSIHGLADVLKLRSVTYKSKNGDDTVFGGLIAEEVHAAGLTEFVAYAPDKTPDSINYGNMVALLVSAIQELTAEVNALKKA